MMEDDFEIELRPTVIGPRPKPAVAEAIEEQKPEEVAVEVVKPKRDWSQHFKAKYNWEEVRKSYLENGYTLKELGAKFDIPFGTLRVRARNERWPSHKVVKRRNELKAQVGDVKAVTGLHGKWLATLRGNLLQQLEVITRAGEFDISRMDEDEIKETRQRIGLIRELEATMQTHTLRGAALRRLELEEATIEVDATKLNMNELITWIRNAPKTESMKEASIDVTTEGLKRLGEAEELAKTPSIKVE